MNEITYPTYQLSDHFLEQVAERLPEEAAESSNRPRLPRTEPGIAPLDLDSVLNVLREHKSRFGLSTGPTVWSLKGFRPEPSLLAGGQPIVHGQDFYLVRFGVHFDPRDGETLTAFRFTANYDKESTAFTFDQFPSTELQSKVTAGLNVRFGIGPRLKFGLMLPASFEAGVSADAEAEASFCVRLNYEWKVATVVSIGPDTQEACWAVSTHDLVGFLPLYAIVRTRSGTNAVTCEVAADYELRLPGSLRWLKWLGDKVEYTTRPLKLQFALTAAPEAKGEVG